jgi:hypothetical protein
MSDFASLNSKYEEREVRYRHHINQLMTQIKQLKIGNKNEPVPEINLATIKVFYDVYSP